MTRWGGKKRRVHKPIKITTMLVGGSACVGYLTGPVPLGREVIRANIPIASHEPRNPAYAGEQLLKLGKQLATDRVHLRVSAWGPYTEIKRMRCVLVQGAMTWVARLITVPR